MLQTFPQCNFSLEYPKILSQTYICYLWLSVSKNSKIMHCGILINMLYSWRILIGYMFALTQIMDMFLRFLFSCSQLLRYKRNNLMSFAKILWGIANSRIATKQQTKVTFYWDCPSDGSKQKKGEKMLVTVPKALLKDLSILISSLLNVQWNSPGTFSKYCSLLLQNHLCWI